jgi:ApaG protein
MAGIIADWRLGARKSSLGISGRRNYRSGVPDGFEELDGLSVVIDDVIYMPNLEAPEDRPHPFVYFINIRNDSSERVSIRGRKWVVREDDSEELIVVEGDGVVGQTPDIEPGGTFSYNSYHVARGSGTAEGAFFGRTEDGRRVFVRIPAFKMELPEWA